MEVGIDRKKDEERESVMRTSQLGGLVGYERIFAIICSSHVPQNSLEKFQDLVHQILLITAGAGRLRYEFCFRSFKPSVTLIIGYNATENCSTASKQTICQSDFLRVVNFKTTSRRKQTDFANSRGSRLPGKANLMVMAVRKTSTWRKRLVKLSRD